MRLANISLQHVVMLKATVTNISTVEDHTHVLLENTRSHPTPFYTQSLKHPEAPLFAWV